MTSKSRIPALLGALSAFIFLCILAINPIGFWFAGWNDGIPMGFFYYLPLLAIGSLISAAIGRQIGQRIRQVNWSVFVGSVCGGIFLPVIYYLIVSGTVALLLLPKHETTTEGDLYQPTSQASHYIYIVVSDSFSENDAKLLAHYYEWTSRRYRQQPALTIEFGS